MHIVIVQLVKCFITIVLTLVVLHLREGLKVIKLHYPLLTVPPPDTAASPDCLMSVSRLHRCNNPHLY